jgi:cytidylate kinase
MSKIIIAIDGYAGCGKSTTAKQVAKALNYAYIDTGAMYRAVTLYFQEQQVPLDNVAAIDAALEQIDIRFEANPAQQRNETFLNGRNVSNEIRSLSVSEQVSEVSALPAVRKAMVAQQQRMGQAKGVVMDGRDIGSNVFPEAELKIFMTADLEARARRRQVELQGQNQPASLNQIVDNLQKRDFLDTSRAEAPLTQTADAIVIDTTTLTIAEQTDRVLALATQIMAKQQTI